MAACQDNVVAIAIVNTQGDTFAMKKFMGIMLGLSLVIGAATVTFAADDKDTTKKSTDKKTGKKTGKKSTDKKTTEKM